MPKVIKPFYIEPIYPDGVAKWYKFKNGYAARVQRYGRGYGAKKLLWEVSVIKYNSKNDYSVIIDTDIANNYVGFLNDKKVEEVLEDIEKLPPLDQSIFEIKVQRRPCPFCGSKKIHIAEKNEIIMSRMEPYKVYYGQCGQCLMKGPEGRNEVEAEILWDSRITRLTEQGIDKNEN